MQPDSDHLPLKLVICCNKTILNSCDMNYVASVKYSVDINNISNLKSNLSETLKKDMHDVYDKMISHKPDDVINSFQDLLIQCAEKDCISKVVSKPHTDSVRPKPWVDNELRDLRKDIASANLESAVNMCSNYKRLKKCKKHKYKEDKMNNLNNMCNSSKDLWKEFKSITKSTVSSTLNPSDVYDKLTPLSSPPQEDYFNCQFESEVNVFMKRFCNDELEFESSLMCDILNMYISEDEICHAISELKKGKTADIDGLPAEFVIHNQNTLVPHLVYMYSYNLDNCIYPVKWAVQRFTCSYSQG